jgi:hypothetical protein
MPEPQSTPMPMLPRRLDQVTTDWLSAALGRRHPGVEVLAARQEEVIAATATKARFALRYNQAGVDAGLPASMILKGGLYGHAHERQLYELYANEAIFYRDVAPALDAEVPACFYADTDGETGLALIEDLALRDARFCRPSEPVAPTVMASALECLAACHARFWGQDAVLERFGLLDIEPFLEGYFRQSWMREIEPVLRPAAPATMAVVERARAALEDGAAFHDAVRALLRLNREGPQTLIHFDAHIGNMYLDGAGRAGWLDWQTANRFCWAWDVAYAMIGGLSVADRRAHERTLLAGYLDALSRHGVRAGLPSFDEAWLAYRRNALWGIFWVYVPDVMQSQTNGFPVIERFWTAIEDLRTGDALGLGGHLFA